MPIDNEENDILVHMCFTGETCSGKTTLINAILEKYIFKGKNGPSTSTICKIRNCEKARIIIEYSSGEERRIEHHIDLETPEGRKKLRDNLYEVTCMSSSSEGKDIRSVDVGFPIPFLKVKRNYCTETYLLKCVLINAETILKIITYFFNTILFYYH